MIGKKRNMARWLAVLTTLGLGVPHAQGSDTPPRKESAVQALLDIVKAYHRPIIGEFADPVPSVVPIGLSGKRSERDVLRSLVDQCPGYIWYEKDGVVVFGDEKLLQAAGNPMNAKLSAYNIPGDLGKFKLTFPGAVESAGNRGDGMGGLVTGIALPAELSPQLTLETVRDTSARNILIKVSAEVGELFSAIVLPTENPTKASLGDNAFISWDIAGGPGIRTYSTYLANLRQ